jgi:hypothetical protein
VFGAVEFARGLGFEPHPEFATAADHLGAWSGCCPIQFGYNGSPFYIQGPYDDVESIARMLADAPAKPLAIHRRLGFRGRRRSVSAVTAERPDSLAKSRSHPHQSRICPAT